MNDVIIPHPSPLPKGEGVRSATPEDAEGIAFVHVNAWKETYRGLMPDSVLDGLTVELRTEQWKNTLSSPDDIYYLTLVAEKDGKIIGFANYGREREGDPEHLGELYAIYVLKEFHGQGIGRLLIHEVAQGLKAIGIMSMLVWVLTDNSYQKFYERMGGVFLREKLFEIGGETLKEKAYGWKDINSLTSVNR